MKYMTVSFLVNILIENLGILFFFFFFIISTDSIYLFFNQIIYFHICYLEAYSGQ